jgi:hypothetical protein
MLVLAFFLVVDKDSWLAAGLQDSLCKALLIESELNVYIFEVTVINGENCRHFNDIIDINITKSKFHL